MEVEPKYFVAGVMAVFPAFWVMEQVEKLLGRGLFAALAGFVVTLVTLVVSYFLIVAVWLYLEYFADEIKHGCFLRKIQKNEKSEKDSARKNKTSNEPGE